MSGVALSTPRGAWSTMRAIQSNRLSHSWRRVMRDQSCVRCSRSTCHIFDVTRRMSSRGAYRIVNVATDVSIVALLYDIPCQSTDRLGQWVETKHCWLGVRPATSAYLKIRWHHCCVSIFFVQSQTSFPHQLAYINRLLSNSRHSTYRRRAVHTTTYRHRHEERNQRIVGRNICRCATVWTAATSTSGTSKTR